MLDTLWKVTTWKKISQRKPKKLTYYLVWQSLNSFRGGGVGRGRGRIRNKETTFNVERTKVRACHPVDCFVCSQCMEGNDRSHRCLSHRCVFTASVFFSLRSWPVRSFSFSARLRIADFFFCFFLRIQLGWEGKRMEGKIRCPREEKVGFCLNQLCPWVWRQ